MSLLARTVYHLHPQNHEGGNDGPNEKKYLHPLVKTVPEGSTGKEDEIKKRCRERNHESGHEDEPAAAAQGRI